MSPSLSCAPVLSECQNFRAPSAVRSTSVTTRYSGNTSTVSRAASSDTLRWLPFRIVTFELSVERCNPGGPCAPFASAGAASLALLSLGGGLYSPRAASRYLASEPEVSVTSRSQSDFPVETTT